MSIFDKLVKNNTLISFFVLFAENRKSFHHQMINARQFFLILMNAAEHKVKKKNIFAIESRSRTTSKIFFLLMILTVCMKINLHQRSSILIKIFKNCSTFISICTSIELYRNTMCFKMSMFFSKKTSIDFTSKSYCSSIIESRKNNFFLKRQCDLSLKLWCTKFFCTQILTWQVNFCVCASNVHFFLKAYYFWWIATSRTKIIRTYLCWSQSRILNCLFGKN
jgi:hypothetical protein